jgi:hypothetical protein
MSGSHGKRWERRLRAVLTGGALLCAVGVAPAGASPATLQRAVQNIVFAPLDLALSPLVATGAVIQNLGRTDDSRAVRVLYFLPGVAWNTGVQGFASVVREIAGVLELLPGIVLLPFARDLPPLFAPAERSPAWIDFETPALRVKVGVDYTVLATSD